MRNYRIYSFYLFLMLAVGSHLSFSQGNINAMEYFIDDQDLGIGANPIVPITAGATISESFTIPTSGLSVGFHTVYFRVQDLGLQWSISESRSFYVSSSDLTTQANVIEVEYSIDIDPGIGSGTSLGAFASTSIDFNSIIPTSALSTGFHTFYTRSLDSDGTWGNLESRVFYISESDLTTTANIVELRYYIDTDPGFGNGTTIPITTSINIDVSTVISTASLSAGYHTIYIRALDDDGIWSDL